MNQKTALWQISYHKKNIDEYVTWSPNSIMRYWSQRDSHVPRAMAWYSASAEDWCETTDCFLLLHEIRCFSWKMQRSEVSVIFKPCIVTDCFLLFYKTRRFSMNYVILIKDSQIRRPGVYHLSICIVNIYKERKLSWAPIR